MANCAFVVQLPRVCSGFRKPGCGVQLVLCLTSFPCGPACNLGLWRWDNPLTKAYWPCHSQLRCLLYDCRCEALGRDDSWWFLPHLEAHGCLGFSRDSGQSTGFEVGFEVVRQLEEMRKLSTGSPAEPVCEKHDWTQCPRERQWPFCSGGPVLLDPTLNV